MAEKISSEEYEKKVTEFAKAGMTSEKIGLELKKEKLNSKTHGKISKILKKHNLYTSPDIKNISASIQTLKQHSKLHPQDRTSGRALSIYSAKLRKLTSK